MPDVAGKTTRSNDGLSIMDRLAGGRLSRQENPCRPSFAGVLSALGAENDVPNCVHLRRSVSSPVRADSKKPQNSQFSLSSKSQFAELIQNGDSHSEQLR